MGAFFVLFLGDNELKEMREKRIEELCETTDADKVKRIVEEIENIDIEIAKRESK